MAAPVAPVQPPSRAEAPPPSGPPVHNWGKDRGLSPPPAESQLTLTSRSASGVAHRLCRTRVG